MLSMLKQLDHNPVDKYRAKIEVAKIASVQEANDIRAAESFGF